MVVEPNNLKNLAESVWLLNEKYNIKNISLSFDYDAYWPKALFIKLAHDYDLITKFYIKKMRNNQLIFCHLMIKLMPSLKICREDVRLELTI